MANKKQEKNEFYNLLPIGLKKSKGLTLTQKNVLATLIYLDWEHPEVIEKNDGWFFESLPKLEGMTNLTKPTILKSFAVLEKKGLIIRKVGSFKNKIATQYKLNHFLLHNYDKKSVKNDDDNFTDKGDIDNIENQLVNAIQNTRKSVKNDDDNFTENLVKISVKNVEDNFTKDKDKDKDKFKNNIDINNIYYQKPLLKVFDNNIKEYFKAFMEEIEKLNQRIDKEAKLMKDNIEELAILKKENKDIIEKLYILEKENTDLKNENSTIKRNYLFLEKRLNDIEDIVIPTEEEYEDNADSNEEEPSLTDPANNKLHYDEIAKMMEKAKKSWNSNY